MNTELFYVLLFFLADYPLIFTAYAVIAQPYSSSSTFYFFQMVSMMQSCSPHLCHEVAGCLQVSLLHSL